jgi:hypothetical protein
MPYYVRIFSSVTVQYVLIIYICTYKFQWEREEIINGKNTERSITGSEDSSAHSSLRSVFFLNEYIQNSPVSSLLGIPDSPPKYYMGPETQGIYFYGLHSMSQYSIMYLNLYWRLFSENEEKIVNTDLPLQTI